MNRAKMVSSHDRTVECYDRLGSSATSGKPISLAAAFGGEADITRGDSLYRSSDFPPKLSRPEIADLHLIPQLPCLVGKHLINQYGLYVDFGEHGPPITCLRADC